MTKAVDIKDIKAEQVVLIKTFTKDKVAFYEVQSRMKASKEKLTKFNGRYGRVLRMMSED